MPTVSPENPPGDAPQYFKTLAELDEWTSAPRAKLEGTVQYSARSEIVGVDYTGKGKLLVNWFIQGMWSLI